MAGQVDQNPDDAGQILLKAVGGLASEPPSNEEVDRAKTKTWKQFDLNMTNSERIGPRLIGVFFQTRDQVKNAAREDVVHRGHGSCGSTFRGNHHG
jgi:hypothetical protein